MPDGIGMVGGISNCIGKLTLAGNEVPLGGWNPCGSVVPPAFLPDVSGA